MAYNGEWLSDIDETQPVGTERKSLGDDAIREIKRILKNIFPNSGANDAYTGTLSQLNQLVANSTIPRDTVVAWGGYVDSNTVSPAGWTICDGRLRASGGNAPDLRGRFVVGSDGFFYPRNSKGGNVEIIVKDTNGQLRPLSTAAHALTPAQLPNVWIDAGMSTGTNAMAHGSQATFASGDGTVDATVSKPLTGTGNQGHSHTFTIDTTGSNTAPNLPPYYALGYIIKE